MQQQKQEAFFYLKYLRQIRQQELTRTFEQATKGATGTEATSKTQGQAPKPKGYSSHRSTKRPQIEKTTKVDFYMDVCLIPHDPCLKIQLSYRARGKLSHPNIPLILVQSSLPKSNAKIILKTQKSGIVILMHCLIFVSPK